MYDKVSTNFEFVNREKKVLDFWNENHIFEKSIDSRKNAETFTFYDGPPTANGKPHIGHVLTRVIKDMIPRYKTMKGYMVPRKAGWDTHGLPVEIEVEKLLGIEGKQGIEEYGLEPFIKKCKESVWKYKGMWEDFSGKVGFWADMEHPYVTYHNSFIESEWWALKQIWDKGLLYKGFKIVPYCPRCGTPLSSQEVAQGYKDVKERSAVVKFKAKDEDAYFLAWTTTPWTLPSNVALCVNPAEDYVKIKVEDGTTALEFTYTLAGKAEKATVRLTRTENVEATADTAARKVNVTVPSDFRKGKFTLMAADKDGRMAVRTVYLRGTFSVETENDLWKTVEEKLLGPGCNYYSMEFKNITRKMHVLEIDLKNPKVEVTTSFADDIVPNPNGNANGNNGFNLRETLSQLCDRKTSAGEDVIAGINTGFFDSNDGIPRGPHVEDGELVFMHNPSVTATLGNHAWAFTIFTDGTASCGKKAFTGKIEAAGKEYAYYSVNDTTVRGRNASVRKSYPVNLYTSRYVKTPHAEKADLTNALATDALYITARYTGANMTVNNGWAEAEVISVADGRTTALTEAPYLKERNEVAIQAFGSQADELSALKAGDKIKLSSQLTIDGEAKPIQTQNSTMWHYITDGENTLFTVPANHDFRLKSDPMTFACVDKSGSRIMLVEIDGRQTGFSIGVNAEEVVDIAFRLGAYNSTRFDGGGSSAMWAKKDGASGLVSHPSDGKGERSCMNYMYVRIKK